ncbi:hypothetical protein [Selenihalanaerobacter shriftii]|uniref:Uncharacterized protein n=1 Tax=Selenihalanaerobacter shriftii TaxID=142842 RepID=A0A1T4P4P7_9FIRM|nr:hypothetical protein [Selenihalanaerobacter shriftii]SJZ86484.1 hypothetical protein SAMN02745118_02056 [Selenihalanaerobacter shriftii]
MKENNCSSGLEDKEEISCPQCGCKISIDELESLRCPRCFAVLLTKCEDCQKCK